MTDPGATDELPPEAFRKADGSPDANFYRPPRLVTHIDDQAIATTTWKVADRVGGLRGQ